MGPRVSAADPTARPVIHLAAGAGRARGGPRLAARGLGRKPTDPRDREIERLKRAHARLERHAEVAEQLIEIQKVFRPAVRPSPRANRERPARPASRDPENPGLPGPGRAPALVLSGWPETPWATGPMRA